MSKKVSIKNRSNSIVIYNIPEMGIRREFMPNEVKNSTSEELEALSYRPGGMDLIRNELLISDAEVLTDMAVKVEPEYYLDDKGVIELLNTGSMDSFLDCLDFAPQGVIEMIKSLSISLPITDTMKIQAFKEKKGTDLGHLIELNKEDAEVQSQQNTGRRVKVEEVTETDAENAPIRRYNVINRK